MEQQKEQLRYETELLRLYWVTAVAIRRLLRELGEKS